MQIVYDLHIKNKTLARQKKNYDKQKALTDSKFCLAVFDLQKVLTTPQGDVGSFYYKRKFATYNFTVYDIGKKQAYCYMWCESDGKRGSNEIGTCLLKFIKLMKENHGINEFSFYSDNCAGQNRNRFIYSMWEYAAFIHKVNIRHTFLEKGHTQNEGDSVHATIECAKKRTIIYVPMQWVTLVQSAKVTNQPYLVIQMSNNEFLDFKCLVENEQFNWKISTNRDLIKWNDVKEISILHERPFLIEIKYDLSTMDFITLDILLAPKKNKARCHDTQHFIPKVAYKGKIPTEKQKIKDLLSLCDSGLIPSVYHDFYRSLNFE